MRDEIEAHRRRVDAETDVAVIHDDCISHHEAMLVLFDEGDGRLRAGGMMGGGMGGMGAP